MGQVMNSNESVCHRTLRRRVGAALILMCSVVVPLRSAEADDRAEYCFSDWQITPYAAGNWSELQSRPGLIDHSVKCTVAGRTGHAAVSLGFRNGDLNVYSWVCNEDGSDCGVDGRDDVQCMGEARTRDDDGTVLDDGSLGFVARIPTIGEEVADVPMDGNANYIPYLFEIRIVCRYWR
jgi:hypothetical protein